MSGLLLKDIVALGDLDRRTCRYVLDRHTLLDIRDAEGQGHHRRFPIEEAIRVAVTTHLVMVGVSLPLAERVTRWAEKQWRWWRQGETSVAEYPYDAHVTNPWSLTVVKGRFVQLIRQRYVNVERSRLPDRDQFYDVIAECKVDVFDLPMRAPKIIFDLTALAQYMAKDS